MSITARRTLAGARPNFQLVYSLTSNRSDPQPLDGGTALPSTIYVFVLPEQTITQVDFSINTVFERAETTAPFDLKGAGTGNVPNPFTSTQTDASVQATIHYRGKKSVISAAFTIQQLVTEPDEIDALVARVPNGVRVNQVGGNWTIPPSGTPVYVIPNEDTSGLPSSWVWCVSATEWVNTAGLGTLKANALAADWTEINVGGDATSGTTPVRTDGVTTHAIPITKGYARSETAWYDGIEGKNFRSVANDRWRYSFDFCGTNIAADIIANRQAWYAITQYLGPAIDGYWGHAPFTLMLEKGVIKCKGQPNSVDYPGTATLPFSDDTWYHVEIDTRLNQAGIGLISVWIDGQPLCVDYNPLPKGTYYTGSGDTHSDLQWVYLKSGCYCGRVDVSSVSTVKTRNRTLTYTKAGTVATWREPSDLPAGTHRLHHRNAATDVAAPVRATLPA